MALIYCIKVLNSPGLINLVDFMLQCYLAGI